MRLFIALPVTAELRRTLEETQEALRRQGTRGRFTPPENWHLTLAFLGSVEGPAPVIEAMKGVRLPRAALTFDRLTQFGDVLVALFRQNDALERYAADLRAALDEAGISYDRKAFRPHITLCRKTALPTPDFRLYLAERPLRRARLPVKEARLYASDLSGGSPVYTVVFVKQSSFRRRASS